MITETQSLVGMGHIERTGESSFKAPEQILTNVHAARAIWHKMRQGHVLRMNLYTEIRGLVQGHPPYDPDELRAAGLEHVSNFNDMSAGAYIERACLAYFNLLYSSKHIIKFNLRYKGVPEAQKYAQILAKNWHQVVTKMWPSFYVNICAMAKQLVTLGISPVMFPDERSPKWRVIELSRFLVPDQTQADLDLLTTVLVENEYTVQYLWEIYKEFKDDKDSPWNLKELGSLLAKITLSTQRDTVTPDDVAAMERAISSGDISLDRSFNDTIRLISIFQKEYEGKVSHYMFHRRHDEGEFLFEQQDQYKDMREALIIFTFNPGEYTLHENKGIGHKIYSLAQAKIQAGCSIIDMVKWSSTPIVKSSQLGTRDVGQIKFLPGVPLDIGNAEFVQNTLGANVQHVVTGAEYVERQMQFNISYSGSDPASPDPNTGSVSPSQARLMAFDEFNVLKNYVQHFYTTFDRVLENMVIKMLHAKEIDDGYDMAEKWKERCIEDGVPEEVFNLDDADDTRSLPDHMEVFATRSAGAGSQVAQLLALQEMQPLVGSFNEREARFFKEQLVTATAGAEFIDMYVQEDEADEASGGASLAGMENVAIQIGKSPIFSLDNEHRSHSVIHATLGNQIMQLVEQQQMDVIEADKQMTVLIPHLQEHMQALSQNMFAQSFLQKFAPIYEQLVKWYQLNRKNAERAAQAQMEQQQQQAQETQQVMSSEQLKEMQTMNDERRKDMKLQAQTERQERAGQAKEQALAKKTDADILLEARKITLTANNERLKHQLDAEVKRESTNTNGSKPQEAQP